MIDNDNTAEQLKCREAFESGVKKWPNYSERTLVRDGRYPDYYGSPVIQGAWEGFKLCWNTRADSGEADIDAMCQAFYENKGTMKWDKLPDCWKEQYRSNMRAAIAKVGEVAHGRS